jgi:hypothetical protein
MASLGTSERRGCDVGNHYTVSRLITGHFFLLLFGSFRRQFDDVHLVPAVSLRSTSPAASYFVSATDSYYRRYGLDPMPIATVVQRRENRQFDIKTAIAAVPSKSKNEIQQFDRYGAPNSDLFRAPLMNSTDTRLKSCHRVCEDIKKLLSLRCVYFGVGVRKGHITNEMERDRVNLFSTKGEHHAFK